MDKKRILEGEDASPGASRKVGRGQEQRTEESAIDWIDRINRTAYQRTLNKRFDGSNSERP